MRLHFQTPNIRCWRAHEVWATSALPELKQLSDRIGSLSAMTDSLPDIAKESIAKISGDQFGKFQEMIETVLSIPGVKPILGPILEGITSKLGMFDEMTKQRASVQP